MPRFDLTLGNRIGATRCLQNFADVRSIHLLASAHPWHDEERRKMEAKHHNPGGHGVAVKFASSKHEQILFEFFIDDTSNGRKFELGCKTEQDREASRVDASQIFCP